MIRNENIKGVINQVKHINESSEKERGYKDECSLTLISNNNKYLLFLRSKNNSTYQNKYGLIGGGIEKGESPLEAMKREKEIKSWKSSKKIAQLIQRIPF